MRLVLFICAIGFLSCSEISSQSGKEIVNKSVEAHGGREAFQELESVSFTKTTQKVISVTTERNCGAREFDLDLEQGQLPSEDLLCRI